MEWVKIMCNILDHRKIKMIRKGPEGSTLVLFWLLILAEAGKCNRGGYLMVAESLPYTAATLSMVTDIPLPTVQLGLSTFIGLDMIDQQDGRSSSRTGESIRVKTSLKPGVKKSESDSRGIDRMSGIKYVPCLHRTRCHVTVTLPCHVTSRWRTEKTRTEERRQQQTESGCCCPELPCPKSPSRSCMAWRSGTVLTG